MIVNCAEERIQNTEWLLLREKESEIRKYFSEGRYFEIINLKDFGLFQQQALDCFFFDSIACSLIYLGISYLVLEQFNEATKVFSEIERRFISIRNSKKKLKNRIKYPRINEDGQSAQNILDKVNEQLKEFRRRNYFFYLSNFAYVLYKNQKFSLSEKYYKKALLSHPNDLQNNLGLAQSYYEQKKFLVSNAWWYRKEYQRFIKIIEEQVSCFATLLAMAKIYYFMKKYDNSLIYVQKALEFKEQGTISRQERQNKKIHAYDWLSRIAYKKKHHSVAITFYEKIINYLIESPEHHNQHQILHPRPKLYKMVKYLQENKNILNDAELNLVTKSILWGVGATIVFGLFESWENISKFYFQHFFITLLFVFFVILVFVKHFIIKK